MIYYYPVVQLLLKDIVALPWGHVNTICHVEAYDLIVHINWGELYLHKLVDAVVVTSCVQY